MNNQLWWAVCPFCGGDLNGYAEYFNDDYKCHHCKKIFILTAEQVWNVRIEKRIERDE